MTADRIWIGGYLGENRAEWGCAAGHTWIGEVIPARVPRSPARPKGPTKPNPQLRGVGETGFRLMVRWWSKQKAGVAGSCPMCDVPATPGHGDGQPATPGHGDGQPCT
jgi:hypothetical protein